ncbi:hypothetical protein OIV83_001207 [Microbotryomycetes sp. JL201]|nr:hypothetical protein OIV83_001207 [Microbotryomycetes sp. JL201]
MATTYNAPIVNYQHTNASTPPPTPPFGKPSILGMTPSPGQEYRRQTGSTVLVAASSAVLTAMFSAGLWLTINPQIRAKDFFSGSGLWTMSNYNAVISGTATLLGAIYGFCLARGCSALLQKRLTHQGVTLREADVWNRLALCGLPHRNLGVLSIVVIAVFASSAAFSGAIQATFGASSTTYTTSRTAKYATLDDAVSFFIRNAPLDPLPTGGYTDILYGMATQSDDENPVATVSGGILTGNSSFGWSSFSYLPRYTTSNPTKTTLNGVLESDHDARLRDRAGNAVELRGTQQAFWASTECRVLPSSVLVFAKLSETSSAGVMLISNSDVDVCDGLVPFDGNPSQPPVAVAYTCQDSHAVNIVTIDTGAGDSLPTKGFAWQCSTTLNYQDIDYVYQAGIGGRTTAARPMQAVDVATQNNLIDYINRVIFASSGFSGLRPLAKGYLSTIISLNSQNATTDVEQMFDVVTDFFERAVGAVVGVYAATLADMASSSANLQGTSGSRTVMLRTILPVTSFGMNQNYTRGYIIGLWLFALFVPVLLSWIVLVTVAFFTPLYPSDFTDPVAVMLQAVSDVAGPLEGMCLGDIGSVSKATATSTKIYFKALNKSTTPRRAYLALDPPNPSNGEALIDGDTYN